jgi:D-amino-acid dehydrogenase
MKVLVLGAGVVGVTSAWYLSRSGHEVTVIDRQPGPGLETSFANGGQLSTSHAEPWANPGAPRQILQWLGREEAPLLFRPRADLRQWLWGMRFLFECLPHRAYRNARHIYALARYSAESLRALRADTGIAYDALQRGILTFHTDERQLRRAEHEARILSEWGCAQELKTPDECVQIEPALQHARPRLVGGVYSPADESGDAHAFTAALAGLAAQSGVRFMFDTAVERLLPGGERIEGVATSRGGNAAVLQADAYVVALGSYSPLLVRGAGIPLPVYPVKGYSVTLPLDPGHVAPSASLTDEAYKIVYSRLGARLRIAGTAELTGYDTSVNHARCEAIVRRAFDFFPHAGDARRAQYWAGLRPATPSNVPLIGRTRYSNLLLNTGHGTLGWTLACGSGRALSRLVAGERPEVDFPFLGPH